MTRQVLPATWLLKSFLSKIMDMSQTFTQLVSFAMN